MAGLEGVVLDRDQVVGDVVEAGLTGSHFCSFAVETRAAGSGYPRRAARIHASRKDTMHVRAALVPPAPIAEAVAALVSSVPVPTEPAPPVPAGRGPFRRRREDPAPAEPAIPAPQLDPLPSEQLQLPLCSFGSLTTDEVNRLRGALAGIAAGLPSPTVWVAGGGALEFTGDRSVWAKLEGDV